MFPCVLRVRTLNAAALGNESVFTQETDRSSPADTQPVVALVSDPPAWLERRHE